MFYDQTIQSGKERTESIEKTSGAGIEWKKAAFFLAAASSMEMVTASSWNEVRRGSYGFTKPKNRRFNQ
jgi:hypothetical protein